MPAKSQQQMKYIYAMRNKYKSKRKAPKNMKWLFDEDWTKGVKMKSLPKKVKESIVMDFISFTESYEFEDFTLADMEFVKDLYNDGLTDIEQISIESDLDIDTVKQIVSVLKKRGELTVNESEVNVDYEGDEEDYLLYGDEEEEETKSCGCKDCNCKDCDGENCECGCCKKGTISESIDIKDMSVDFQDHDEYIQPVLNIKTKDGKKFYINLKSFDDFEDDGEY